MKVSALAACIVVLFLLTCGCLDSSSYSRGVRSTSWSTWSADEAEVPGITTADVGIGELDGKVAVVFWADSGGGEFGVAADPAGNGTLISGQRTAVDGRTYTVSCTTDDGTTGRVTIDGQDFELQQGSLFLISTLEGTTRVKQLDLEIPRPDLDLDNEYSERLRDFARDTPELHTFFQRLPEQPEQPEQPATPTE